MSRDACLFCKIADGKIPSEIVHQDSDIVVFKDIRPQAPIHLQLIPREHVARVSELAAGHERLTAKLIFAANDLAKKLNIADDGYRLVINCNAAAGQSVYHLHLHLLGGRPMGWPPG